MAIDSPYFKFYVSEWNDGDIQLCSMEAQGLFSNLCSLYWSKEGELFLSKAKRLFKVRDKSWKELIDERVIKIENDKIIINFLDEQLQDLAVLSNQNRKNAVKRWRKPTIDDAVASNGNASDEQAVCNIEGEEKREEEKRREERESEPTLTKNFSWFKKQFDERYLETMSMTHKGKDIQQAILESYAHLAADKIRLNRSDQSDCRKLLNTWLSHQKINTNGKQQFTGNRKQQHTANIAASVAETYRDVLAGGPDG